MYVELRQHFWFKTPYGEARAIAVIDYGQEDDLCWVCIQQDDPYRGQCWTWHNSEIRFQNNSTFLRRNPVAENNEKRDPSSHRTPTQIRRQVKGYNSTPENIRKRSLRNKARRIMKDKVGAAAIAGKDVDHKRPVRSGGGNGGGNLRVQSPHKNRGWRRDT